MRGPSWNPGTIARIYLLAILATVVTMFQWSSRPALLGLLLELLILSFGLAFVVIALMYCLIFAHICPWLKSRWRGPLKRIKLPSPVTVRSADLLPRRFRWFAKRGQRQAPLWDHWLDGH